MAKQSAILIKNIYYMLAYAFNVLNESNYERISGETFTEAYDLFASILGKGISQQLKRGLHKEYIDKSEDHMFLRGRLNLPATVQNRVNRSRVLHCEYDSLSVYNLLNQVLKTTAGILSKLDAVKPENRTLLRKELRSMAEISDIEPALIPWGRMQFHRQNHSYRMLMAICRFVLTNLIYNKEKGAYEIKAFDPEEHLYQLFENFVRAYYKKHYPQLYPASVEIKWDLDRFEDVILPKMRTDISLTGKRRRLIIDTKFYSHNTTEYHGRHRYHSAHLYQVYTYVKNMRAIDSHEVSGLLLYAKSEVGLSMPADFLIGGNRFGIRYIDLNQDFNQISAELNRIVEEYVVAA